MHTSRTAWKKSIGEAIKKAPRNLRQLMEEYMQEGFHGQGGECAVVGTYIKPWVNRLRGDYEFQAGELKHMKKMMRTVTWGARLVMREYARLRDTGDKMESANLRQTGISEHLEKNEKHVDESTKILRRK